MSTYPSTIFGIIVVSEHRQCRTPTNSNLLHKWHEIVWDPMGILTNIATMVRTNWIEVSQQYDFPFRVWAVYITTNFFNVELKEKQPSSNQQPRSCICIAFQVWSIKWSGHPKYENMYLSSSIWICCSKRELLGTWDHLWPTINSGWRREHNLKLFKTLGEPRQLKIIYKHNM